MSRAAEARPKLDLYGLDAICADIADGLSLTAIAGQIGVSFGSLATWIDAEPVRSARVTEARRITSRMWDEKALEVLEKADEAFGLAKAKELSHHYRWRAKMVDPGSYGDKGQVNMQQLGANGQPVDPAPFVVQFVKAKDGRPE